MRKQYATYETQFKTDNKSKRWDQSKLIIKTKEKQATANETQSKLRKQTNEKPIKTNNKNQPKLLITTNEKPMRNQWKPNHNNQSKLTITTNERPITTNDKNKSKLIIKPIEKPLQS